MNSTRVLLLLLLASSSVLSFFSEESLKDLSRLPHLQRHWQLRKVTTPPTAHTTTTQESSLQVLDQLEVSTSRTTASDESDEKMMLMTISLAKERLKARRMKMSSSGASRKKTTMDGGPAGIPKEDESDDLLVSVDEAAEVKKHIQRMAGTAACSVPSPRLIYVRREGGHGVTSSSSSSAPNVRYLPECTWLHRCSDDAGCCLDESKTCSPANIQSVSLPFFVLQMTDFGTKRSIIRVTFENHTSCECVGRNADLMPRTEPAGPRQFVEPSAPLGFHPHHRHHNERHQHHHHHRHHSLGRTSSAYRHSSASGGASSVIHSKCRCPSGFSPAKRCSTCQCKQHRHHCDRLRRGLSTFSLRDRGCISDKKCQVPACDYGLYITFIGRCPRREERSQSWLRMVT